MVFIFIYYKWVRFRKGLSVSGFDFESLKSEKHVYSCDGS